MKKIKNWAFPAIRKWLGKKGKYKIVSISCTRIEPIEYGGLLDDGRVFAVQYYHGNLWISIFDGNVVNDAGRSINSKQVYYWYNLKNPKGTLTVSEVFAHLKLAGFVLPD